MAERYYAITRVNTHAGSDSQVATFDVGVNEKFVATHMVMNATSTNAAVTDIRNSSGLPFGSLSATNLMSIIPYVPSTSATNTPIPLPAPITIEAGEKLYITTLDGSGAGNSIVITLIGKISPAK